MSIFLDRNQRNDATCVRPAKPKFDRVSAAIWCALPHEESNLPAAERRSISAPHKASRIPSSGACHQSQTSPQVRRQVRNPVPVDFGSPNNCGRKGGTGPRERHDRNRIRTAFVPYVGQCLPDESIDYTDLRRTQTRAPAIQRVLRDAARCGKVEKQNCCASVRRAASGPIRAPAIRSSDEQCPRGSARDPRTAESRPARPQNGASLRGLRPTVLRHIMLAIAMW